MECNEIQQTLADYASGDTSGLLRNEIETHLAHCYVCREELSQHDAVLRACRKALRHPAPVDRWDELRAHIVVAVAAPPEYPGWRRVVVRRAMAGTLATAAMLALTLWSAFAPTLPSPSEETAAASPPVSLAPDGLIAVAATSRDTEPFQRYKDTVAYYFQTLDFDAPEQSEPGTNAATSPHLAPNPSGSSIEYASNEPYLYVTS